MAVATLNARVHDSSIFLDTTSMLPASNIITPMTMTTAISLLGTMTFITPKFLFSKSSLLFSAAAASKQAPAMDATAKATHIFQLSGKRVIFPATTYMVTPKSTSESTIHHLRCPVVSIIGERKGRSVNGSKKSDVTSVATPLLISSRLNITRVTAMSITTTIPLAKQSRGNEAWNRFILFCIFS